MSTGPPSTIIEVAAVGTTRRIQQVGLAVGPILLLGLLLVPPPGLDTQAERLAAVLALVIVYWVTEALPLPVTALLGVALSVVFGAAEADVAFAGFADPVVLLLIGSFILVEALHVHALDRRIALALMSHRWVGDSTLRTLWATGVTAVIVSAWVNNSATAAMLFPAVQAMAQLSSQRLGTRDATRYQTALLLMLAYGVSIGGMVTPVGTPTNLLGIGLIEAATGVRVSFITWMLIGGTVAGVLLIALFGLLLAFCRPEVQSVPGQQADAREAAQRLGVMTRDQRLVAVVFGLTIAMWLLPAVLELLPGLVPVTADTYRRHLPESIVALLGASLLFVLRNRAGEPLMDWQQAATIDWGTVLLLGGGATLGRMAMETGLAPAIGRSILQMPVMQTTIFVVLGGVLLAVIFSEVASNTAAVNLIVPVLLGVSVAGGFSVTSPAVAATLGASLGFMLPVATPPNAMVYASGLVSSRRMLQLGLMLDLVGILAITLIVLVLGAWILPTT